MAAKSLRTRALHWLRAFTDRRLYREQLRITVTIDGKRMIIVDSLEAMMMVKYSGGYWINPFVVENTQLSIAFECIPVQP